MKLLTIFTLGLAILSFSFNAESSSPKYMYKWKSADGEIHYSERPPRGVKYTRIRVADDKGSAPVAKPKSDLTNSNDQQQTTNVGNSSSKYQEWRKENCKIATQNLDVLQNDARIAQDDGQGGTRLMSDEEKQANIKKMLEQQKKYCAEEK